MKSQYQKALKTKAEKQKIAQLNKSNERLAQDAIIMQQSKFIQKYRLKLKKDIQPVEQEISQVKPKYHKQ